MRTLTCPSCGAMCDPDTHRCLRCNTIYNEFIGGVLDFEKREPQWFSFQAIDNLGRNRVLNIYGTINYDGRSQQLTFTAQKVPQPSSIFLTSTKEIDNALEN